VGHSWRWEKIVLETKKETLRLEWGRKEKTSTSDIGSKRRTKRPVYGALAGVGGRPVETALVTAARNALYSIEEGGPRYMRGRTGKN